MHINKKIILASALICALPVSMFAMDTNYFVDTTEAHRSESMPKRVRAYLQKPCCECQFSEETTYSITPEFVIANGIWLLPIPAIAKSTAYAGLESFTSAERSSFFKTVSRTMAQQYFIASLQPFYHAYIQPDGKSFVTDKACATAQWVLYTVPNYALGIAHDGIYEVISRNYFSQTRRR